MKNKNNILSSIILSFNSSQAYTIKALERQKAINLLMNYYNSHEYTNLKIILTPK